MAKKSSGVVPANKAKASSRPLGMQKKVFPTPNLNKAGKKK